ncbi:MAG: hypothetical protein ACE5KF_03055 [Kiloniellaceae bacterium]
MVAIEKEPQQSGPEVTPSSLDEATHAELRVLYGDCSNAIRFAKDRQWKLVGATLLVFTAIMALTEFLSMDPLMARGLVVVSFLVGGAAICVLIIYQIWQHTELGRLRSIGALFSDIFTKIRGPAPEREAKIHGYLVLFMMIVGVLLGNAVTVLFLSRMYL